MSQPFSWALPRVTGFFQELPEILELPNPDLTPLDDRTRIRLAQEQRDFDLEHYALVTGSNRKHRHCSFYCRADFRSDEEDPLKEILAFPLMEHLFGGAYRISVQISAG